MRPAMTQRRQSPHRPSKVRGVALIEALVGILIFAFGVVGLVGLQVAMAKAQGTAKYRADAAFLGSQVLGTIWADRSNLAKYNGGDCADHPACNDWLNKVQGTLPAGTASVASVESTGIVNVTITWTTSSEGTHSHVLSSQIR
jgi:type IV pilus assembly protein PilV